MDKFSATYRKPFAIQPTSAINENWIMSANDKRNLPRTGYSPLT